ncbi:MAG: Crp/Fnr family transcriptional regulator [Bacteroidota bacterium]
MEELLFSYLDQFLPLTEEEKQLMLDLNLFQSFPAGTILAREGQYIEQGYFVLKGCVRSYYLVDGEEKTTSFYTENEGCELIRDAEGKATHYLVCVEDSIFNVSTPSIEEEAFRRFPRFESLCRILSEHIVQKKQIALDSFRKASPLERYVHLLETRPELLQRVPLHQIASFLGITPESLSRIRKRLAERK